MAWNKNIVPKMIDYKGVEEHLMDWKPVLGRGVTGRIHNEIFTYPTQLGVDQLAKAVQEIEKAMYNEVLANARVLSTKETIEIVIGRLGLALAEASGQGGQFNSMEFYAQCKGKSE